MMREHKLDFTVKQNNTAVMGFLLPLMLSGGFQYLYAVVNAAILGRAVSMEAVAVVGACSTANSLVSNLYGGMASGAGFYFSRCVGSGQRQDVEKAFGGAVYVLLFLYVPAVLAAFSPQPVLRAVNVPGELWTAAGGYLRYVFLGAFFVGLKGILIGLLQGYGESRVPGFLAAVSVVTQSFFTYFYSDLLHMGAKGSAAAVLFNNLIFCVILLSYVQNVYGTFSFLLPGEIGSGTWRELWRNMYAKTGLMMFLWLGSFVFQRQVNRLPETVIAADAYVTAIYNVCTEIVFAYGTAALVATGQNYGSRERDPDHYGAMIRYYNRKFLLQGLMLSAGFLLLFWTGGETLIRWTAGSQASGQLVETAAGMLRIIGAGYPALAILLVCRCALQSMGQYRVQLELGILGLLISVLCSFLVLRYGAVIIGLCIFLKLLIPGCWAGICYGRCIGKLPGRQK